MSATRTLAIAQRIARQFLHDKRTLGLLFVVPILIISLLGPLLTAEPSFTVGLIDKDKAYAPSDGFAAMGLSRNGSIAERGLPTGEPAGKPPGQKPVKASDKVIDALKKADKLSVLKIRESEVGSLLKAGKIIAVLEFPEDFSEKLLSGGKPNLSLILDGSNPSRAQGAMALLQKSLGDLERDAKGLGLDVSYKYGGTDFGTLDYFAPMFIAFFAFFFVFLLTSVSFLRERGQGTIERLMSSPASRLEIILGYQLGFIIFATIQVAIIMLYTIYALKVHYVGNLGAIFLVVFLLTLVGVNMGIFFSSFAANELQVVQFIPIVITPQGLLSGVVIPIDQMPKLFQWLAEIMPLTHAGNALRNIMIKGYSLGEVSIEIAVLIGFALLMVVLSAATIKREIA